MFHHFIIVKELETIGYRAVAFGFFEDDVQAVYTTDCCCVTAPVVEYIRAVIIAGKLLFFCT